MSDNNALSASAVCACSISKAYLIPAFDRQSTKGICSTAANLTKQKPSLLGMPPSFVGNNCMLYAPVPGLITGYDQWISTISWSGMGGVDETVEVQNAAGQTIWRGVAQAVDDSNFSCVKVDRLAAGGYKVPVMDSGRLDVNVGRPLRNGIGGRS